ncbi:uncharacterized protein [Onthophagus taurus]|uniref:uncharacterized protein n=1 Tax=Onthophagus taurus TaxID=166361 RepID=UPI0039BE9746
MLKKQVKSKCAQIRQNAMRTDGGPQKEIVLTSIEERIKGLILLSVEGLPANMYDSHSVPNCNLDLTEVAKIDVGEPLSTPVSLHNKVLSSTSVDVQLVIEEELVQQLQQEIVKNQSVELHKPTEVNNNWTAWNPQNLKKRKCRVLDVGSKPKTANKSIHDGYNHLNEKRLELTELLIKQAKEEHEKKMELLDLEIKIKRKQAALL